MQVTIWFDGASKGNPGPAAGGAVLEYDGTKQVLHGRAFRGTSNEAEYEGLILGLEAAKRLGATALRVVGDSQLVIRQLEGAYQVRAPNLKERFQRATALLSTFTTVRYQWVRRDQNQAADQAANEALARNG